MRTDMILLTCYQRCKVDEVCGNLPDAHDINHTQRCPQVFGVSTGLQGQVVCGRMRKLSWQQLQEPQHS